MHVFDVVSLGLKSFDGRPIGADTKAAEAPLDLTWPDRSAARGAARLPNDRPASIPFGVELPRLEQQLLGLRRDGSDSTLFNSSSIAAPYRDARSGWRRRPNSISLIVTVEMRTKDDDTDENRAATFGTLRTMSLKASVSSRYFTTSPALEH